MLARHWGLVSPFPPGRYWFVEGTTSYGVTLYWNDILDDREQTGWCHAITMAAGFGSLGDVTQAWRERGLTSQWPMVRLAYVVREWLRA